MELNPLFTWADYLVVAVVLVLSASVGFFYACTGGKQKTTKEYLMANNNMHWFPVAASLVASYISTQTMIGTPSEVYAFGTIYGFIVLSILPACLLSYVIYLPVFGDLKLTSIYEFMDMRFGRPLTFISITTGVAGIVLRTTLVIYGPSLAFAQGLDLWLSVTLLTAVAVLYTVLGGLKAVLWADSLQFLVMVGGFLTVLVVGVINEGGFGVIWEVNKLSGRLDFLDAQKVFDFDQRARHTFWTQFFGGLLLWSNGLGTTQTSVQRLLALRSRKDSLIAYTFASLALTAFTSTGVLIGLVIFAHFKYCDPLSARRIFTKDQLYPLYIMELFGRQPGLSGLMLSSVFSASLSTVSTTLSAISTIILQSFVRSYRPKISERNATLVSKLICVVFGVACIGLVAFARYFGQGLVSMGLAFAGMTFGPNSSMFFLGIMVPIANRRGTIVGFFVGLAITAWKGMGGLISKPYVYKYPVSTAGCNVTDPMELANLTLPTYDPSTWNPSSHYRSGLESLYDVSYAWNGIWGFTISVVVSTLASIVLRKKDDPKVHIQLLSPFWKKVIGMFPEKFDNYVEMEGEARDYHKKPTANVNESKAELEMSSNNIADGGA